MRRLGLAGLSFAAWAAVVVPSAAAPGPTPAPAGAADAHPGRTGNLVALVRSPRIAAGVERSGRESLLDTAKSRISGVVDRTGLSAVRSIPELGAVAVRPAPGESLARARRDLRADPAVRTVEVEHLRTLRYLPDDPALVQHDKRAPSNDVYQWNLRQEQFPKAWRRTRGGKARLAVLDTGLDGGNPDLSGRIAYSKGFDYGDCGPGLAQPPCTGPRHDEVGHGTHVGGLACAQGNNGVGIAGAAFACKLIVEKVSDSENIADSLIAKAITNATNHHADVISMSFGGPGSSRMINRALDYAYHHDVVLVAAASNDNTTRQGSPASHLQPNGTGPKITSGKGLVVTAAGHNGRRAWFHPGHGTGISLAAYGSASGACAFRSDCGIFSTFPDNDTVIEEGNPPFGEPGCGHCRATFHGSNDYAYLEGTSMATPQVAGAAALIRSKRPGIKNTSVLRILKRTADNRVFRDKLGWGILNAGRALKRAAR
jgi:subtilisin family serine protease